MELFFKKSDIQANRQTPSNKPWHSRFYHKQFEGYTEFYQLDENGKKKLLRVYTAPYYRPNLTKTRQRVFLLIRFILILVGIVFFYFGATQHAVCNMTAYSAIFQALSIPPICWSFFGFYAHLSVSGDMKIGEYKRAAVRTRKASLAGTVFLFAGAAAALLAGFFSAAQFDTRSALCALLYLLSGSAFFALNRLEKSVNYQIIDNPAQDPTSDI